MKIAILGATSFIAQEYVREWVLNEKKDSIHLYARSVINLNKFIEKISSNRDMLTSKLLSSFPDSETYDVIINCIGVGDPAKAKVMSECIMDVTFKYDDMVLNYLDRNRLCKYIFLSSGAAYGSDFSLPASVNRKASFDINNLQETEKYGLAKFMTEVKHRNLQHLSIIDVRVFNFFSRNQDISSRFFVTDLLRAILNSTICDVSPESMVRDYLHPKDFFQIIDCLLNVDKLNISVDCYSLSPVDKLTLLDALHQTYNLQWQFKSETSMIHATGAKCNYFSKNKKLERFGYKPKYSSLDTILTEFKAILP
ncbi:NAD-dependent epimerase/dehydratase family protein [Aeromonas hydrophila]|uniref:NAD-dependent epimerase/dehydratase family protein n=1 Tax=Aeromonas hydrophila TaxID=644 RepID=UPI0009B8D225|nr:NAD(P)-dependent oxidoreductase [Aeromonas hydrophila]